MDTHVVHKRRENVATAAFSFSCLTALELHGSRKMEDSHLFILKCDLRGTAGGWGHVCTVLCQPCVRPHTLCSSLAAFHTDSPVCKEHPPTNPALPLNLLNAVETEMVSLNKDCKWSQRGLHEAPLLRVFVLKPPAATPLKCRCLGRQRRWLATLRHTTRASGCVGTRLTLTPFWNCSCRSHVHSTKIHPELIAWQIPGQTQQDENPRVPGHVRTCALA